MPASPQSLSDAGRDLLLGSACLGCGVPGRVLCRRCDACLPRRGAPAWPTPTPRGLAPPFAAGAYDGLLKTLVNQHKEHAVFALARPLGRVLGDVVHDLVSDVGGHPRPTGTVLLVPVPSRRSVVRRRGHDPLLRVAREATRRLRRHGVDARVLQALLATVRVRDQALLDARERATNLAGSMSCRRGTRVADGLVILVDDVLTTGATAREAQRALEQQGIEVTGVATVAATTRRRGPAPGRDGQSEASLPFSGWAD